MVRAARDADKIAGFDFDRENRSGPRMDVEEPAPFDDETHFIFIVEVLAAELCEHHVQVRRVRLHVDDIGRDVPAARFQPVDLTSVSGEERVGRGIRCDGVFGQPSLVLDAVRGEKRGDIGVRAKRHVLRGYLHDRHGATSSDFGWPLYSARATLSSRNSTIST